MNEHQPISTLKWDRMSRGYTSFRVVLNDTSRPFQRVASGEEKSKEIFVYKE